MSSETKKLVTQKEFARLCGITPGGVNYAKKNLGGAVEGRRININHPLALAYREKHNPSGILPGIPDFSKDEESSHGDEFSQDQQANGKDRIPEVPDSIPAPVVPEELADLTLSEIVERYGSLSEFRVYVSAQKDLSDYQMKHLKYQDRRNELIEKRFFANVIFEIVENLYKNLVEDVPMTVAQKTIAIARREPENALHLVQREYERANGKQLKICKETLAEKLKYHA